MRPLCNWTPEIIGARLHVVSAGWRNGAEAPEAKGTTGHEIAVLIERFRAALAAGASVSDAWTARHSLPSGRVVSLDAVTRHYGAPMLTEVTSICRDVTGVDLTAEVAAAA